MEVKERVLNIMLKDIMRKMARIVESKLKKRLKDLDNYGEDDNVEALRVKLNNMIYRVRNEFGQIDEKELSKLGVSVYDVYREINLQQR